MVNSIYPVLNYAIPVYCITMCIGVRADIHLGGKQGFARMADANCFQPTRFGGGGVVAEIFSVISREW